MFELLIGVIILVLGVCFLVYNIKETKKGYKSDYGNDIGLYFASLFLIMIGIALIYRSIF